MPKQKTHRASAKRFKRTANGGLKRHHAYTGHRLKLQVLKYLFLVNMLSVTVRSVRVNSENYGLLVSTLLQDKMVFHTLS